MGKPKLSAKGLLRRLVENGLDFLRMSLKELRLHPKYSVIHFYAGVELLLKARLMAEHWSLVVSKRQEPDWGRFQEGDFISVTLEEAADRLERVARSGLTRRELEAFRGLGSHRNRMVHFFHEASSKKVSNELVGKIAGEQLRAWFFLERLISERWSVIFQPWMNEFKDFSARLRQLEDFLKITYRELQPELKERAAGGENFSECPSCEFTAFQVWNDFGSVYEGTCLVCKLQEHWVAISCPQCDRAVTFFGDGFATCGGCQTEFQPSDLARILDEDERGTKAYFESGMPAHCANCEATETVVAHGGRFVCASCFSAYEADAFFECSYCGSRNAGELTDSAARGCVACRWTRVAQLERQ